MVNTILLGTDPFTTRLRLRLTSLVSNSCIVSGEIVCGEVFVAAKSEDEFP
jgi:hypothetical protein